MSQVLTRYPPLRDTGDDDITTSRNKELLIKELEKDSPRKEIVLSPSRQTYGDRRATILSESEDISVSSLIQKFNELKKPYVVCTYKCVYFMPLLTMVRI